MQASWPGFSRPSTSYSHRSKTWMRGTSPRMTWRLFRLGPPRLEHRHIDLECPVRLGCEIARHARRYAGLQRADGVDLDLRRRHALDPGLEHQPHARALR